MAGHASISTFLDVIERSGLLDADQLRVIAAESATDTPEDLAANLVQRALLTRWQAELLLQGKYRGFRLGPYRLLELIGKGGMGSVYLAEHGTMHRRCAIKVLASSSKEESSTSLARFHREAQAIAALDHPNIVRAFDVSKQRQGEREIHYLVMEYIEGRTLQRIVEEDGPLSCSEAAEYLRQTARGLAHAHQRGVIHRDIKPSNLILAHDGKVKILDLGLVSTYTYDEAASLSNANKETLLGTADYVSPEQALGSSRLDERTDLYSLGCVAYFLLTGQPPFPTGTVAERLLAHQLREPEDIAERRPDIPAGLAGIVKTMLAKNPLGRFQTASTVEAEITVWLDSANGVLTGEQLRGEGSTIRMRSSAGETRQLSKTNDDEVTHAVDTPMSDQDATPSAERSTQTVDVDIAGRAKPAASNSYKLAFILGAACVLVVAIAVFLASNKTPNSNETLTDAANDKKNGGTLVVNPSRSEAADTTEGHQLREEIRNDPDTVLYLSFSDTDRQAPTLANEANGAEFSKIQVEVHGQPQRIPGRFPQTSALRFGGPATDQWLQISPAQSTAFDFAGSFTLALWVRLEPFSVEYQCLIAKGDNGWRISRSKRTRFLHFAINEPVRTRDSPLIPPWAFVDGETPVDDGRWHFVAAVFDAEREPMTMSLYLDGELDGVPATSEHRSAPNEDVVTIGANAWNLLSFEEQEGRKFVRAPRHIEGDIDEVIIMRRPLTAERIRRMYELGRPE